MRGFTFPGERQLVITEKQTPTPGPGQVLIKTRASAICGTDLHLYRQAAEQRSSMAEWFTGHEPVGEVMELGAGVTAYEVGARVVGYHVGGCGRCDACQVRHYKECAHWYGQAMAENRDGSNAEFIVLPVGQVLPLPDGLSYEHGAVLACNFGTAWGAMKNAWTFPGGTVAVWGLGPVGLCIVAIATHLGMRVIGVEPAPGRRRLAEELGAEVLDATDPELVESLRAMTNGRGPESVIDTSGIPAAHQDLVAAVRTTGQVVLVGLGHPSSVGPTTEAILKQLTIVGSWIYDIEDWPAIVDFVMARQIDLDALIDVVASPDQAVEMFARADAADGAKVVFRWE